MAIYLEVLKNYRSLLRGLIYSLVGGGVLGVVILGFDFLNIFDTEFDALILYVLYIFVVLSLMHATDYKKDFPLDKKGFFTFFWILILIALILTIPCVLGVFVISLIIYSTIGPGVYGSNILIVFGISLIIFIPLLFSFFIKMILSLYLVREQYVGGEAIKVSIKTVKENNLFWKLFRSLLIPLGIIVSTGFSIFFGHEMFMWFVMSSFMIPFLNELVGVYYKQLKKQMS